MLSLVASLRNNTAYEFNVVARACPLAQVRLWVRSRLYAIDVLLDWHEFICVRECDISITFVCMQEYKFQCFQLRQLQYTLINIDCLLKVHTKKVRKERKITKIRKI